MNRRQCLAAAFATVSATLAARPGLAAPATVYEAQRHGVTTRLSLSLADGRFEGRLEEPGLVLALKGTVQDRRLVGQLHEPTTGLALVPMQAELRGDELLLQVQVSPSGPAESLGFRRVGAPPVAEARGNPARSAAAAAGGRIDPQLVGRWRRESHINSPGGAGGFASFSTVRTLELSADGQVQQRVRSVGGGSDWSHRGGDTVEFTGLWQARGGELWVQPAGQSGFVQAGRYRFVGERLVTESAQGRQVWSR